MSEYRRRYRKCGRERRGTKMLVSESFRVAAPQRNMDVVFREIAERALREREEYERKTGPINSEMGSANGTWHVLVTHPQHERIALAHLAARRFGAYVPMLDRVVYSERRQKKQRLQKLMFPGYVFVFVWSVVKNYRRITNVPGVARMLMSNSDRPAVLTDEDINRMQAEEAKSVAEANGLWFRGKNRRRRWRKQCGDADDTVTYAPKSYFDNIGKLDENGRNGVLQKALGLL